MACEPLCRIGGILSFQPGETPNCTYAKFCTNFMGAGGSCATMVARYIHDIYYVYTWCFFEVYIWYIYSIYFKLVSPCTWIRKQVSGKLSRMKHPGACSWQDTPVVNAELLFWALRRVLRGGNVFLHINYHIRTYHHLLRRLRAHMGNQHIQVLNKP